MEFRILGPLEVSAVDGPVALGGGKQRALLALLLLNANRVVATDRLIDELWQGEPPETARKALQVHVSNLRKALGAGRIVTESPGYRLFVEPGELDLDRFETLRAEGGAESLRRALALWRGPPLANFAYEPFAQAEIARLEELRLATLEQRIDAELAEGRNAELVPELERLVAAEPLRERLRGQLMLALYRSGRQADALEAYRSGRRALLDELGLEPGRALQELQAAILRQDETLDLVAAPRAPKPPLREPPAARAAATFVGRERELARCVSALDLALGGRGRLLLVSGEPGIGKSRLVEELVGIATERGAEALVGRCWEAGGAPPFWPWAQALREHVRRSEPRALRAQLGTGAADVATVVPDVRTVLPDLPEPVAPDTEGARFRVFESVATFLAEAGRAQPLVVCLDDLHAADTPSLLLLQFVGRELERMPVFVIGAYRDVDPTVSEELMGVLAEVSRHEATTRLALGGLSRDEVRRFVELNGGGEAAEGLAVTLHDDTDGNPLFVGEMVRLLAAEGRLQDAGARVSVPDTVREVIGRRLRHLSSECRRVLTLASIMGREFGLVALERVADYTGIDRLLEVLDEATAARIVAEVPGALGRLRFAHALIGETLYTELPATHRVRLHKRVAEVLEQLYAADPEPHLAELAHHHVAAVPAIDPAKAVDYARRAGDRALALLAYEEAARLYESAAELVEPGDEQARCDLLLARGEAESRAGDSAAAKQTFLKAAEIGRRLALPRQLSRAAAGYGGRSVHARAGQDAQLVPLLEEALAALEDDEVELRVRLLSRLAGALRDEPSRERREALSREALELARQAGNPAAIAQALDGRAPAIVAPDTLAETLAVGAELCEVAARAGDKERQVHGHMDRMVAQVQLGDMQGAEQDLAEARSIAAELRQPAQLFHVDAAEAMLALATGRFSEGAAAAERAIGFGERSQPEMAIPIYRLQRFTLLDFVGDLTEVEPEIRELVGAYPTRPVFRCALTYLHARLGRLEEAEATLRKLSEDDFSALPFDQEWLYGMSFLAETSALLGDADSAASLYRLLLPWAALSAANLSEGIRGAVSRYLGLLATTLGRQDDAAQHFEDALEANRRMGLRPWLARTQQDYAELLRARGERERAQKLLDAALATFRELGMAAPGRPQAKPDAVRLARAALGYGGRMLWARASQDPWLVPLLEEGLEALGEEDPELRVRLLVRLAGALRDEHASTRRNALTAEAVELARRTGSDATLAYALDGRASSIFAPDAADELLELTTELCAVAEQSGDQERIVAGYMLRVMALVLIGDVQKAENDLMTAERVAQQLKQPIQLWHVCAARAMLALSAGRLDEAEDLIPRALALGERAQPEMVVPVDTMQRFTLCAFRGTLDEIAPAVRELVAEFPARTAFRCALALLDARLGRRAEAKRSLDELVGDDCSALPFDQEWLWGMSLLAETAVLLDDAVSAEILYRTLSPWHALNAVDHPEGIRGSVSRYLGLLAATLGRDDDAMRHFEDAIAMNERMGALPWLAYTQYDYGRLLLARGRRERAEKLLDAALATFRELGMAAPGPPQAKPDALRLARAALGYGGRIVWGRAGDDERLVPLLEEALDALGDEDPGLRAKLLARLAGALRDEHSRERRDRLSREAVEVARHAGDLGALAYALDGRCAAVQGPDVIEESLALATELCELAERTGDRDALAAGYDHRVSALLQLGDIARVEADLGAARRIAEELKQPARLWEVTGIEAMLALAKGRLDEAEQLIPRAFALGERAQPDAAIPVYTLQRYALREFRGGVEELEPEIAALVADYPARPVLRCALAHLHARTGRVAEARQALAELARNDFAALPFDQEWLLAMSMLAEVCVTTGGDDEAAVLYRLLEPWSHLNAADPGEGFRGSVARYLALVAVALGRLDDAERHFAAALEMNERMGVRPWVEYTQREYTAAQASRA